MWSSAEMAVTLICIGIPVCRPLYKRVFRRLFGETSSSGYHKQSAGHDNSMALRTIGGGVVGADGKPLPKRAPASTNTPDKEDDGASFSDVKLGVNGPFTRTTVGRGSQNNDSERDLAIDGDDASDEEILDEFRRSQQQRKNSDVEEARGKSRHDQDRSGIMVTETYRVERS